MSTTARVEIARLRVPYDASVDVVAWLRPRVHRWPYSTERDPRDPEVRLITVYARASDDPLHAFLAFNRAIRAAFPPPRPWLGWEDDAEE